MTDLQHLRELAQKATGVCPRGHAGYDFNEARGRLICKICRKVARKDEYQRFIKMPGRLAAARMDHRWRMMISRCHNPAAPGYHNYGARGISVCDRWRFSKAAFLADVGNPPDGHSLDRIDNDGDYEPGNVRWSNQIAQSHNSRRVRMVTLGPLTLPIAGWTRVLGCHKNIIYSKIYRGQSPEEAVEEQFSEALARLRETK